MIKLHGSELAEEHAAATRLRQIIQDFWPDIETDNRQSVDIIASVKTYGNKVNDVDIVVLGSVNKWHEINNGSIERYNIRNFCMAVEVKAHTGGRVRFIGNEVEVFYDTDRRWHAASEQSDKQGIALRNYLSKEGCRDLFTTNLIWLENYPHRDLPSVQHNIVGKNGGWGAFLDYLCNSRLGRPQRDGTTIVSATSRDSATAQALQIFTRVIETSPLDRKRMERASRTFVTDEPQQYIQRLGEQLLIFRGRGGTGKTSRLIQLAHHMYINHKSRVLFLTYNRALVADIRRLFGLMNISSNIGDKAISVNTVHSYIRELLIAFSIMPSDATDFLEKDNYSLYKRKLLDFIGGARREELEGLLGRSSSVLTWDFTLVDEAQDWPADERDILYAVQGFKNIILADGVDQLVRSNTRTDWQEPLSSIERRENTKTQPLRKSLRLKAQLCTFVNELANELGVEWKLEPLDEVYGGKVVIVEGSWEAYSADRKTHDDLIAQNKKFGNFNVDTLFCIPPKLRGYSSNEGAYAMPANVFQRWGYKTWDGVAGDVRDSCPTSLDQIRIVQYDSCRGLEGWMVVNFEIDAFYDHKIKYYNPTQQESSDLYFNLELAAKNHALQWLLIPLTRAIDTLVIQVKDKTHPVSQALFQVANRNKDIVEWRRI